MDSTRPDRPGPIGDAESFDAVNRRAAGAAPWLGLAGLLGLVAVLYRPVLGFEFVNWDDPWYVLKNPLITSWHPANLWRMATEMSVKNYAPLTTLSLLVDHTLYGFEAGGYHLTNVLLHAANAMLVFVLVGRLAASRTVGLLTAVLFAVHPVQIESVAWVSSRKTLLCSAFMLASGLCWLRSQRTARQELWGTGWLLLALLAKAAAIVMPPIVLAYDVLVRRKTMAEALPRQLVPGLGCLLLLNVTMSAQASEMGGVRSHLELGKLHILAVDAVIVWEYVGMLAWPAKLSVMYDPQTRGIMLPVIISLSAWMVVAMGCWRLRVRSPLVAWAVFTWFCLLCPVLNFLPITTLMNDRYLYLPCLCVFGLAAGGARRAALSLTDHARLRWSAGAAVVAIICTYSGMTMSHLPVWQNDFALWNHTISRVPQLSVVQIQWADALHAGGETERAVAVLRETLKSSATDEPDRERVLRRLLKWES